MKTTILLLLILFISCEEVDKKNTYIKSIKKTTREDYKNTSEYTSAFDSFKTGDFKNSYKKLVKLLEKYPNDLDINFHIGFIVAKSNNLPLAEKFLFKTIELDKSKWQAYKELAILYKSKYMYKESLKQIKEVFKYERNDSLSNFIMGYLSNKIDKNDNAYIYYARAIKNNPNYMLAYIHYGEFYYSRKLYSQAEKIWEKALKIKYSPTIAKKLGLLFIKQKKYDKAMKIYNEIINKHQNKLEAYFNIGKIYELQNNFDKAIEYYNKANSLNKIYDSPKIALSEIYLRKKEFDKVIKIYKDLHKQYSHKTTIYLYKQAQIFKKQKKEKEFLSILDDLKKSKLKQSSDFLKQLK